MSRAAHLRDLAGFMIAVAAAGALLAGGPSATPPSFAAMAAVAVIAVWIAWQDITDLTIPDGAVAGLMLVGAADRIATGAAIGLPTGEMLLLIGFDAVLAGGSFWIVREVFFRRRGFDGLGFGDVKLAAAGAVLVGATGFAIALGAASLVGIVVALLLARRGAAAPGTVKVAFGAVLAPALALVFVAAAVGFAPGPLG